MVKKDTRRNQLQITIDMLWLVHGVKVEGFDIYVFGSEHHLSTAKTAELFHTSYHNFSNAYVPYLMQAGVVRVIAGRHKYYNINHVLAILTVARKRDRTVFEICDERYENIKRLRKNRRKKHG